MVNTDNGQWDSSCEIIKAAQSSEKGQNRLKNCWPHHGTTSNENMLRRINENPFHSSNVNTFLITYL